MLNFFKMHGLGNDYIFLDRINLKENLNYKSLAKVLSDRNYGIGGDGLIVLLPSKKADFKMLIFNSDGTQANICGTALRCACFYYAKKYNKQNVKIELLNNIIKTKLIYYKNNLGYASAILNIKNKIIQKQIKIKNKQFNFYLINVGNNHAVTFVDDFNFNINYVGNYLNNKIFKNGINVEFVKILNNNNLFVKVFERGSGQTKACGSGASATAYIYFNKINNKNNKINIHFIGGKLKIIILNKKQIKMLGECKYVFKGGIKL